MTDFVKVGQELADGMGQLAQAEPETMKAFKSLMGATAGCDGELSIKMKELIALAIAITVRCDGCIAHHVKLVVEAGATRREVVETIGVAQLMGGGPATVYGVEALKAFDQFKAA
ncbi:carboxymuconolactone decarboxylase family protein [Roseospirillum parvum]|uniref:Alkylhydroperoxidase AhpD family core domain-containing protein n=1 Tax=Roseospirillum parvum TaxID=83401 RepID=A0A1G8C311_9PROT|nr:carboxymuconolactone decarboxylase family protein [Roseospirillum parvum]SDH39340.1 alkylhydroperoxidase AhpD family core domain-containing protein [Roseospirillum parvum]